jgi:5-methylcytosine-specific restriction protein B
MSLDALVDLIHSGNMDRWGDRNSEIFENLFGGSGRYAEKAKADFALRAPGIKSDSGVPFSAYIHPQNPKSGAYGGLSFVVCPVVDKPSMFGLVVGTGGLAPDHAILGRPGHARKALAICNWLNDHHGHGRRVAWAKQDPTRTDISLPSDVVKDFSAYKDVFDRYGAVMYAIYQPTGSKADTGEAVAAFLDLMMEERGHYPLKAASKSSESIRAAWFEYMMPTVSQPDVANLLVNRKYVVLQGPPGTGKTRMATELLRDTYGGFGQSIQFHPNTSYENFVGGLSPVVDEGQVGLKFRPAMGFLMKAAAAALKEPKRNYLLHIDEINRADLGKTLGEAIYLLEAGVEKPREIELAYDFGEPFGSRFSIPSNLHILGTMNSADRSIAILDVAVRRRFAFLSLWPSFAIVKSHGCELMQEAFQTLTSHFVEHSGDEAFALLPGHSYFLEKDAERAKVSLKVNLAPLLEEYLAQGYVGGFSEQVRSYLQWLRAL